MLGALRLLGELFYKNSNVQCCEAVSLGKRLDCLNLTVHPALFWCAGSWNLRGDQFLQLRGVQRSMFRKMCGFKKQDSEDLPTFMQRTNRSMSALVLRFGVTSWDVIARRLVFTWGGWVARLASFDPNRLTLLVLRHKDLAWIQQVASDNRGRQLHCRILKTWRWEASIFKYFACMFLGQVWLVHAQDPQNLGSVVQSVA